MKLKDILGICMYNWYGGGGHSSIGKLPLSVSGTELKNADGKEVSTIRAISNFKLHRAFVDNWIVVPETQPPFTLKVQPTEQNFYFDDYFKLQKANGITNIWSASGCFDWYVPFLGGKSQRKTACYDPRLSPTDPNAWQDLAQLCKLIAERYKDNGLVDYIQVLNEWDFRWNVPHILTPEEYAVGFYECYKAIRSVSSTQKIMVGCTLTPEMQTFTRLFGTLDTLAANEGKPKVRDVTVTFNLYSRTQSANQGDGIGATFEEVNQYGRFLKPLNDWCKQEGLKWGMTESGYNSSPSTSAAAMKNKAPLLEGFTLEQAQGILAIRTALICASLSECVGITFYHTKDGYEAEPFTYHGFNYDKDFGGKEDWSAKPARTICEDFLSEFGIFESTNYQESSNGIYSIILSDGRMLAWTDNKNAQGFTPFPKLTTTIPPIEPPNPTPMIKAFITTGTTATYEAWLEISPGSYPVGKYAIYVDGEAPVTLELLKDGVSFIAKRTENGKPLAVGGDDNGALRLKDFPAGSYKLVMNTEVINFTVGTVTPPPTGDIAGTSFALKPNGQIEFVFSNGVKKLVNPA